MSSSREREIWAGFSFVALFFHAHAAWLVLSPSSITSALQCFRLARASRCARIRISVATVTYLFEDEIIHRDSLGFVQPIQAGAVNLMTAGRGIVHSERAGEDLDATSQLHGIQLWFALPADQEEYEPACEQVPAASISELDIEGTTARVIMGELALLRRIRRTPHQTPRGFCHHGGRAHGTVRIGSCPYSPGRRNSQLSRPG